MLEKGYKLVEGEWDEKNDLKWNERQRQKELERCEEKTEEPVSEKVEVECDLGREEECEKREREREKYLKDWNRFVLFYSKCFSANSESYKMLYHFSIGDFTLIDQFHC